jgi:hypothetical protein
VKPIATIHWTVDGEECSREYYERYLLEQKIEHLKKQDRMFYVCINSTLNPLPSNTPVIPISR